LSDVSEVLAASIITALMMEAASTSETLVNFYPTVRRNNPEDSHLHASRRENVKSDQTLTFVQSVLFKHITFGFLNYLVSNICSYIYKCHFSVFGIS
jgi:hypothetical protein